MEQEYAAPKLSTLGEFPTLTLGDDKIGSNPDFITQFIPSLDGSIVPDRR
jgi:hypothetical protein